MQQSKCFMYGNRIHRSLEYIAASEEQPTHRTLFRSLFHKKLYQQHCSAYEGGNAAEMKVHNQLPNPSNQSA
jgi:hypothetical protein